MTKFEQDRDGGQWLVYDIEDWLNPQLSLEAAQALLVPFPAERMTAYQVSTKVNAPAFNAPEAVQRVPDA